MSSRKPKPTRPLPGSVEILSDGQEVNYDRPLGRHRREMRETITPMIDELINYCHRHNIPLLIVVEHSPGEFATSAFCPQAANPIMKSAAFLTSPGLDWPTRELMCKAIVSIYLACHDDDAEEGTDGESEEG